MKEHIDYSELEVRESQKYEYRYALVLPIELDSTIAVIADDCYKDIAEDMATALSSHAALLEAAERAKSTFELFASQGGRLAEEAEIKVAYLSAAIAKAKAEQS